MQTKNYILVSVIYIAVLFGVHFDLFHMRTEQTVMSQEENIQQNSVYPSINRNSLKQCGPEFDTSKEWTQPTLPSHLANASQDSEELISHICQQWILPPSTKPRRLQEPNQTYYSQIRQDQIVDRILKGRENGFFIECGAADGEKNSNTLYLEKTRNWKGVLIEGYLPWFKKVLPLHRHAYSVGACLSSTTKPMVTQFANIGYGGGIVDQMDEKHVGRFGGKGKIDRKSEVMQCLPLYSILRALGVRHVDYFSLDIEGAELAVLKSLPLREITVDVFTIEYTVGTHQKTRNLETYKKLEDILAYLKRYNYEVFEFNPWSFDVILKRKGI